jgi:hypothetical protein
MTIKFSVTVIVLAVNILFFCKYLVPYLSIIGKPSAPNYSHRIEQFRKFIESIVRATARKTDSQVKIHRNIESIFTDLLILIDDIEIKCKEAKRLIKYYIKKETNFKDLKDNIEISSIFIKNQPSLLLAPVNTGLESAILQPLASIVISLGLNIKPTLEETYALIKSGNLFM